MQRRTVLAAAATAAGATGAGLFGVGRSGLLAGNNAPLPPLAAGASFPKLPIGMNLAGITDWENGFPFRNLFWGAGLWHTRNLVGPGPFNSKAYDSFEFDAEGYPLEVPVRAPGLDVPQTVFAFVPNRMKPGKYILLYDGDGTIEGIGETKVLSSRQGRLVLQMTHDGKRAEGICISKSKRGNHVRNIRILSEADEKGDISRSPFLTEFTDFCRPFHCLRFMDWGMTNSSVQVDWNDRKKPGFYTMRGQSGDPVGRYRPAPTAFERKYAGSVTIETMVQLANDLEINPWFSMPHLASDEYIAEFAKLVRQSLAPERKVYLEFSNELWNWSMLQAGWMMQSELAGKLVEAKGGTAWEFRGKRQGANHPERIGALFRRTFEIWEREWTGADRKRLIRVCAVQAAWSEASRRTVKWCVDHGGADVVSPAAYIGPNNDHYARWASLGAALTPEEVISDLRLLLSGMRKGSAIMETVAYAKSLGLGYVAYEAGQHIQPKGQAELPYNPALAAAQKHPAMYDLYVELMRFHRDLGCQMFGHFSSVGFQGTRFGSWGAKERYDTPNDQAPKMRALLDCNAAKVKAATASGRSTA